METLKLAITVITETSGYKEKKHLYSEMRNAKCEMQKAKYGCAPLGLCLISSRNES